MRITVKRMLFFIVVMAIIVALEVALQGQELPLSVQPTLDLPGSPTSADMNKIAALSLQHRKSIIEIRFNFPCSGAMIRGSVLSDRSVPLSTEQMENLNAWKTLVKLLGDADCQIHNGKNSPHMVSKVALNKDRRKEVQAAIHSTLDQMRDLVIKSGVNFDKLSEEVTLNRETIADDGRINSQKEALTNESFKKVSYFSQFSILLLEGMENCSEPPYCSNGANASWVKALRGINHRMWEDFNKAEQAIQDRENAKNRRTQNEGMSQLERQKLENCMRNHNTKCDLY